MNTRRLLLIIIKPINVVNLYNRGSTQGNQYRYF